jgi:hypothetical protein
VVGVRVRALIPASLAATGAAMIAFALAGMTSVDGKLATEAADRQPVDYEVLHDRPPCPARIAL